MAAASPALALEKAIPAPLGQEPQILDRAGICVRAGHHCTMPLHERFDLAAAARASFNVYTIREEIDALAAGLREVARIFDR